MDEEKSFLPWFIFLSVIVVIVVVVVLLFGSAPAKRLPGAVGPSVTEPPPAEAKHPLAGKWRSGEFGTLIVYADRWAAVKGVKFPWEPVDDSAIRIELDLERISTIFPAVTVMGDFRLRPASTGGQAVLKFLETDYFFDRIEDAAPGGGAALP
jgi:hypothetical protein